MRRGPSNGKLHEPGAQSQGRLAVQPKWDTLNRAPRHLPPHLGPRRPSSPGLPPRRRLHALLVKLLDIINRRRYRKLWDDPVRKVRTLESFGQTEDDGGRDLLAAGRRATDPEFLQHIERHAREELLHGELFRRRAAELRADSQVKGSMRELMGDKNLEMLHARDVQVDGHGFYDGSMMDEMGEVAYVATVHVVETRALETFEMHRSAIRNDEKTLQLFDRVAADEKYHISYTGRILDRWRTEGRTSEVEKAIKEAKRNRFFGGWKRLGVRCAAGIGKVVLFVFYYTLLLPFGLLTRGKIQAGGWFAPLTNQGSATARISSQY
ncbi:MAG: hypothetical protein ACI841_003878 [Planctomycetota bacterium]